MADEQGVEQLLVLDAIRARASGDNPTAYHDARLAQQDRATLLQLLDRSPLNRSALMDAADRIAELCGCPSWEYPGQLVRDVQALVQQRDALLQQVAHQKLQLDALRAAAHGRRKD